MNKNDSNRNIAEECVENFLNYDENLKYGIVSDFIRNVVISDISYDIEIGNINLPKEPEVRKLIRLQLRCYLHFIIPIVIHAYEDNVFSSIWVIFLISTILGGCNEILERNGCLKTKGEFKI